MIRQARVQAGPTASLSLWIVGGFFCLMWYPAPAVADTIAVIVPEQSRITSIPKATLKRIFLGMQREVSGERVTPVQLPISSEIRRDFNRAALGMSEKQVSRYWLREALAGGAAQPAVFEPDEIANVLQRDTTVIGYLPIAAARKIRGVKIVAEIP